MQLLSLINKMQGLKRQTPKCHTAKLRAKCGKTLICTMNKSQCGITMTTEQMPYEDYFFFIMSKPLAVARLKAFSGVIVNG